VNYLIESQNKYNDIEFEIIKENWNEYQLNDESKLKARIILTRVFRENSPNQFGFEFSNPIFVVSCPIEKRGKKNDEPKQADFDMIEKEEVTIISDYEKWNEYKIKDLEKTLRIKYSVSTIQRLKGKYDNNGYPFYIVTGAPAITML
jgi:hypothetical protein